MDLTKVNFERADLSGANLGQANLDGASLDYANLSGADLFAVSLIGAPMRRANLRGAVLTSAKLVRARLGSADLSGAQMNAADLSGAYLTATRLKGANLDGAHLGGATFEPVDLPDIDNVAGAEHLSRMIWYFSPQGLVRLRNAFREGGYRDQEREVTYAIKHSEVLGVAQKLSDLEPKRIDPTFRYIFFELTTQWGMSPGRSLWVLLGLIPIFAFPYVVALRWPGKNGIWRVWAEKRLRQDVGTAQPERLQADWLAALALALYFSVLSAFNIGWRDLNVGNWIQRLQPKEYTLGATGWVRTVSGLQSLISVYLLAIWALTYFGRPFD